MAEGENGAQAPQGIQIVVTMDDRLGCRVQHNCPGGDVVEMMLYRALKYVERELAAGRLLRLQEPKITVENSFPKGLGL
jgi:hypothetical protein